jgi:hypothetical protein
MNDLAKNLLLWVVVAVVLMVVFQSFSPKLAPSQEVVYSQFVQEVQDDRIKKVDIASNERTVKFERADGSTGTTTAPVRDQELISDLINHKVEIKQAPPDTGVSFWSLVLNFLPVLLIIGFWLFMMRQMQGGGGGKGAMSFGKSRAKLLNEDQVKVTFADVAGCDEAKEEVSELVDFLRDPSRFQKVPARRCWRAPSRARRRCRSSRSPARTSWRCSSASARRACATCSSRRRSRRPASSSSTKSTRSAAIAGPAWAVATTSASRPSTRCWSRWTASRVARA